MARIDTLGHFLTDVADAIRSKTGSSETISAEDFDTEIENIPSGGGTSTGDDVVFYDYDGTKLHSYSKADFLELTEMPASPTHSGLVSQGWNWTLADAKTHLQTQDKLDIGQMYDTDDGSLRITIKLEDGRLSPYLGFGVNGTATIDWGDGSATDTVTGTDTSTPIFTLHNYSQAGEYTISISSESDIHILAGSSKSYLLTANGSTTSDNRNTAYRMSVVRIDGAKNINNYAFYGCGGLKSITIPSGVVSIGSHAFEICYSLSSIIIPSGITSINEYILGNCRILSHIILPSSITSIAGFAFQYCYSLMNVVIPYNVRNISTSIFYYCYNLQSMIIPSGVTSIPSSFCYACGALQSVIIPDSVTSIGSSFSSCNSLKSVTIPDSVTSINNGAFQSCSSLRSITISNSLRSVYPDVFNGCNSLSSVTMPKSITSISSSAFANCQSVGYYDFSNHTSVPTLSNVNAFTNIASDCKIIVPNALYEDWIVANNWSNTSIVSHIIKKSDWDNL